MALNAFGVVVVWVVTGAGFVVTAGGAGGVAGLAGAGLGVTGVLGTVTVRVRTVVVRLGTVTVCVITRVVVVLVVDTTLVNRGASPLDTDTGSAESPMCWFTSRLDAHATPAVMPRPSSAASAQSRVPRFMRSTVAAGWLSHRKAAMDRSCPWS